MTPEKDPHLNAASDEADAVTVGENNVPEHSTDAGGVSSDDGASAGEPLSDAKLEAAADAVAADEASAGADESIDMLRERLAAAEERANNNWERLLRMQADLENQRKRAQKDVQNARKFALEAFVNDLLPVKDSMELGLAAARAEDARIENIIEGSELTLKMLTGAFEKHNVVEIDPLDAKFNPDFHEAMSMQEVEGKATNTVTAVMQKGYVLNDRLIRPALVMVAK